MERYAKNHLPFIYTAFAGENAEIVLPLLSKLSDDNIRFWYHDSFSSLERRKIACAFGVLLFVSKAFAVSPRFHQIVDFAVQTGQKILCVYLEDVPSCPWLELQLGSQQALRYSAGDDFLQKLKEASVFHDMSVTPAQKKYQKRKALTLITAPLLAALILFFAVIQPLLVAPMQKKNELAQRWGLTAEDLEKVTALYVAGDTVYDKCVHGWYEYPNRTQIAAGYESGEAWHLELGDLTSEDLEIVKYMPNLRELCVSGNKISDITPLLSLEKLELLDLSANPISSLEGIEKLSSLVDVRFSTTDIQDVSPLWKCENLRLILLDNTYITDISGVENLKQLEQINLTGTKVSDMSPLEKCEYLNKLEASITEIETVPLVSKTENAYLDVDSCPISDYSALQKYDSFDMLRLSERDIAKVLPYIKGKPIRALLWAGIEMESLRNLKDIVITPGGELNLAGNTLQSLDGLENFSEIGVLDLKYANNLEDLTPLLTLKNLTRLTVSSDMKDKVEKQLAGAKFQIEYRDD